MNIVKKIEVMAARLERAREIVRDGLIYPIYGDEEKRFVCKSHSGQQDGNGQVKLYLVTATECTCADFRHLKGQNGGWCKHRIAREILINEGGEEHDAGREGSKHPRKSLLADGRGAGQAREGLRRRAAGAVKSL